LADGQNNFAAQPNWQRRCSINPWALSMSEQRGQLTEVTPSSTFPFQDP
jgi:hypothetical protein